MEMLQQRKKKKKLAKKFNPDEMFEVMRRMDIIFERGGFLPPGGRACLHALMSLLFHCPGVAWKTQS